MKGGRVRGIGCVLAFVAFCGASPAPGEEPMAALAETPAAEADDWFERATFALTHGDPAAGRAIVQQAADAGDPEALNALALYVESGVGGEPDPLQALELLESALAKGSKAAKLNLGLRLLGKDRPHAQHARGAELLNEVYAESKEPMKAIAAGHLGRAYAFGLGVTRDIPKGARLLEEGAALPEADPGVLFLAARARQQGWEGVEPDPERSAAYFRRAAEGGHAAAQWHYGMVLLHGEPKDEIGAYMWIRKAAEGGDLRGMLSTAVMLATGEGVGENDPEARTWYQRAANDFASAHALRGLGGMLLEGEGGANDTARGWAYITLAADAGEETAKVGREHFADRVSARDRRKSRMIAAKWIAEHGKPSLLD
jgi:uncharacterized protein